MCIMDPTADELVDRGWCTGLRKEEAEDGCSVLLPPPPLPAATSWLSGAPGPRCKPKAPCFTPTAELQD